MNQEVSSWVVNWFSARGKLVCRAEEALPIDYLQAGLLTSLEIVEFVGALEDHFAIQLSEEQMQDPRFSTIGGIADLIAGSMDGAAREQADEATKVR